MPLLFRSAHGLVTLRGRICQEHIRHGHLFRRTWQFYLAFSEAGFAEARIRDVQMLFAKPHWSGGPRLAADMAAHRDAELAAES